MNNNESKFHCKKSSAWDMLSLWGYSNYDEATPTARFFYDNIESGNAIFWSLCDGEHIVGELYSFLKLDDKDFADGKTTAYLCAFRVNKDYRGKGYGTMLMNTALSDLKSKNFSLATIGVGMDEENNQRMYEHMGFNTKIIRKERSDDNGNEMWFPLMMEYFDQSPYAVKRGISGEVELLKHFAHRQELEMRISREIFPDRITVLQSKNYSDKDI